MRVGCERGREHRAQGGRRVVVAAPDELRGEARGRVHVVRRPTVVGGSSLEPGAQRGGAAGVEQHVARVERPVDEPRAVQRRERLGDAHEHAGGLGRRERAPHRQHGREVRRLAARPPDLEHALGPEVRARDGHQVRVRGRCEHPDTVQQRLARGGVRRDGDLGECRVVHGPIEHRRRPVAPGSSRALWKTVVRR